MKQLKTFIVLFVLTFAISCGQQKKYLVYKVKEGETMRTIAKKLNLKTKELLKLNPTVGRKPKPNTKIVIPNSKTSAKKQQRDNVVVRDSVPADVPTIIKPSEFLTDKYVLHKVKKGDTFYSLTRFYNVSQDTLVALNPQLSEGLKLGDIIKIKEKVAGEKTDRIYNDVIEENAVVKIGLLLPFRAQVFDTLAPVDIFKDRKLPNIVTDFYLGADIAIDSLRQQGVQIALTVFDTGNRNTKIDSLVAEKSFDNMQVLIGPLYSDETERLAKYVHIPVIYPIFSGSQTNFSSSKIVKTAPDKKLYQEKLLAYISKNYTNQNIVIVGDSTETSILKMKQIANFLKQNDSIKEIHQIVPNFGYIAQERFLKLLKPDTTKVVNWVVLATENSVIASDAVNSLISFPEPPDPEEGEEPQEKINYTVKAFAFEKQFFNQVNNNKLAQIGFTYVSSNYIDESSLAAKQFNAQYLRKNNALPSENAVRGFDVMYDLIMRLASGNSLNSTYRDGVSYRLESKFDMSKKLFGLTENNGLFLLEYQPDLSLKRLE